jgi:hypothetical protein
MALREGAGSECECTMCEERGRSIVGVEDRRAAFYMYEETLQRTMTVGLVGTKPEPHAQPQVGRASRSGTIFTTFASHRPKRNCLQDLAASVCGDYVSLSHVSGSHK